MTHWQEPLAAVILMLLVLIPMAAASLRRGRDRRSRAAQRKLETVLRPRETVKAVCPQSGGRWILTSQRLLRETRRGFTALELRDIRRVRGTTADGKTTTVPGKMASLTIQAQAQHTIRNTCAEFAPFAAALKDLTAKKKK